MPLKWPQSTLWHTFGTKLRLWTDSHLRERRGQVVSGARYNEAATKKSPDRPNRAELFWQIGVQVRLLEDTLTLGPPQALRELDFSSKSVYLSFPSSERSTELAKSSRSSKPSKAALSKAGKTLASNSSSKPAKSNAGSTLGKG